tara:strand:+ start:205 stop:399 length:195 start_codon:yes stop_codon:yes gene_type:complete
MTYIEENEQKIVAITNAFVNCDSSQFSKLQSQLNQCIGIREGYNQRNKELEEDKKPDLKVAEKK